MLTWALLAATFLSLAAALYKDRKIELDTPAIKRALRINIAAQIIIAMLAALNTFQAEHDAKQLRALENEKAALVELSRYQIPIRDNYSVLVQNSTTVSSYIKYTQALKEVPPELNFPSWEEKVSPTQVKDRDDARAAFNELQRISREILALNMRYGERVPSLAVNWAQETLALRFEQVPQITKANTEGLRYANLLGEGIGITVGKLIVTQQKIEQ